MKTYERMKILLSKFFIRLFRIKFTGVENIPTDRAVIVCPNHLSNWDPFLIAAITDVKIHFMAKKQLFKVPIVRSFVTSLGAFPVNRGSADPSALKTAIKLLKDGGSVGVFPQGTRHGGEDPENTQIKSGIGMIAYRSGADVVPVAIKTKNYKIKPFRRVYINVGKPIPNSSLGLDGASAEGYTRASETVFSEIIRLGKEI